MCLNLVVPVIYEYDREIKSLSPLQKLSSTIYLTELWFILPFYYIIIYIKKVPTSNPSIYDALYDAPLDGARRDFSDNRYTHVRIPSSNLIFDSANQSADDW